MRTPIIIALLSLSTALSAATNGLVQIQADLDSLDLYIAQREVYIKQKDERIGVLRERLKDSNLSLDEQYRLAYMLFEEYLTYNSRLMKESAERLIGIAKQMGDKNKIVDSQIRLAYTYLWCGAFKDALEYANTIDTVGTIAETQAAYLLFRLDLEFESGLYVKELRFFTETYEKRMTSLIRQLETLVPADDVRLHDARQKERGVSFKYEASYQSYLQKGPPSTNVSRQTAGGLGGAGYMFLELGDTVSAVHYMTLSAIMDIKLGSRQSPALRKIAETVYPLGDLEHAYRYIQLAMDNAVFFGSPYRMYESSISLPQIDKDLYEISMRQKNLLVIMLCVIALFVAALMVALLSIRKKNRQLKRSFALIREQNTQLLSLNEQIIGINRELLEANDIKDAYLGKILADNSTAIRRIEDLVKAVTTKLKVKQYDDIVSFIYKHDFLKGRREMLERFDEMFLNLFPDYIEQFNSLLKADERIVVEKPDSLTPELRIFALVRLGVTKSDTIAEILNFSASTVRNYKTKIRNSGIVANDDFDNIFLKTIVRSGQ